MHLIGVDSYHLPPALHSGLYLAFVWNVCVRACVSPIIFVSCAMVLVQLVSLPIKPV